MSTSAADPDKLSTFVHSARQARLDAQSAQDGLTALRARVAFAPTVSMDDGGMWQILTEWLRQGEALEQAVLVIRDAFLAADSAPGMRSLEDAAIQSALAAAGAGIPGNPPVTVESPQILGEPVDSGVADDPVNTANGNFVERHTDLPMPGRAIAAAWVRTYSSRSFEQVGALGRGWSCWADAGLVVGVGVLTWRRPDGSRSSIPAPAEGASSLLPGGDGELARDDDGYMIILNQPHERWRFDLSGRLVSVSSGATEATFDWSETRLTRVTHQRSGRFVDLAWSADPVRITGLTSSDGRTVDYRYDEAGDLTCAVTPAGEIGYEVADGLIRSVVDADGVTLRCGYDAQGRVLTQQSPEGRTTLYSYLPGHSTVVADDAGVAVNAYQHDASGRLLAISDDSGRTLRREYDDSGGVVTVVARGGGRWTSDYDEAGNVVRKTDPEGGVSSFEYDEVGRPIRAVHHGGHQTRWTYRDALTTPVEIATSVGTTVQQVDDDDLPVRVVDPDGVTTVLSWTPDGTLAEVGVGDRFARMTYDAAGRLVGVRNAEGHETTWELDAAGRLLRLLDPRGAVTEIDYTPAGRPASAVDAGGGRYTAHWSAGGQCTAITDPLGSVIGLQHDDRGNLLQLTAPDGRDITFRYDGVNRLVAATDPAGRTTTRGYDPDGNLIRIISPLEERTEYRRDALGRMLAVSVDGHDVWSRNFGHDGRVRSITLPGGSTRQFEYDTAGRLLQVDEPAGRTTLIWTPGGRLASVTDREGTVRIDYDQAGDVAQVHWPDGTTTHLERDRTGRIVRAARDGGDQRRLAYDRAGDLLLIDDDVAGSTTIARDLRGYPVQMRAGDGATWAFGYDLRGALTEVTDPVGATARYGYDSCGRIEAFVDPLGDTATYQYDVAGRPGQVTDPLGHVRVLERDADGRMVAEHLADGSGTRWWLDALGRVVGLGPAGAGRPFQQLRYGPDGLLAGGESPAGTTLLQRDDQGRLERVQGPSGSLAWRYAPDGWLSAVRRDDGPWISLPLSSDSVDGPSGPVARAWRTERDAARQIVRAERGDLVQTFGWDAGGRLVEESDPTGRRHSRHDRAGRLVERVGPSGTETFRYDDAGRRLERALPSGERIRYVWGALGQLTAIEHHGPGPVQRRIALEYDALGLLRTVDGLPILLVPGLEGLLVGLGATTYLRTPAGVVAVREGPGGSSVERCADLDETGRRTDVDLWGAPIDGAPAVGVRVGGRVELEVDGLVVQRHRVLDPGTRSYLSPDPLGWVAGMPGGGNPYAFAFNDPQRMVDPLGARPLSDADLQRYWAGQSRGAFGNAWENMKEDPLGTAMMVVVVAVGVGLEFVPGGQVVGTGILIGAATSGGIGLLTGDFDPRAVALGGALGGALALTGPLVAGAVKAGAGRASVVGIDAAVGAVGDEASYLSSSPRPTLQGAVGAFVGGGVSGALGGLAGPAGKSFAMEASDKILSSSMKEGLIKAAINGGSSMVGKATEDLISTGRIDQGSVFESGVTGIAVGAVGDKMSEQLTPEASAGTTKTMSTLEQVDAFAPRTWSGATNLNQTNTRYIVTSAVVDQVADQAVEVTDKVFEVAASDTTGADGTAPAQGAW